MKNDVMLYDLEIFPSSYFECGLKNFKTKEVINLEVSEWCDDRKVIYDFFSSYDGYLVSFNGIYYDNMLIKYFLKEYKRLVKLEVISFLDEMKLYSDKVINSEQNREYLNRYRYVDIKWTDLDIFLFWSKMLRQSKKISLKSLGIQLGYPVVQELPYNEKTVLTKEQIEVVRKYNNEHDLGILDLLTEKMKEEISLRFNIRKEYGLDCLSWDAIKIASESLLQDYCEETLRGGETIQEYTKRIRNLHFERNTIYIKDILNGFDPHFELPIFKNLYQEILGSINSFDKELPINIGITQMSLALGNGGLHSQNKNEIYHSTDTHVIMSSDVGSLYPNLIINYNCIRFPEVLKRYKEIKAERMIAKKAKDKKNDTLKKLQLNGISGLLDNPYSWLYYPEGALRLRLIGQLIMVKTAETCILNGWKVIAENTDSIDCIVPILEIDKYYNALSEVEKQFNIQFEHEQYNSIYYLNINNYLSINSEGKIKRKGLFKIREEIPLGDSVDELVIPVALQNYLVKGIPIEETIISPEKHSLHIYDYCCSNKISKASYEVFYDGKICQNLNRYYFSTPAPFLLKKKKEGAAKRKINATFEHVNVADPVILFNEFIEKDWKEYNINYNSYIKRARKIINELESSKRQLTLF